MVDGAFSLSSMAWSQIHNSGKRCTASSLKTWECRLYLSGISLLPFCDPACSASLEASICFLFTLEFLSGICTLAMYNDPLDGTYGCMTIRRPAGVMLHVPMCVLGFCRFCMMRGNWLASIHPLAQSMFGCVAANHGYPRMILLSPMLVRKKCSFVLCCPVCISKSV